MKHEPTSSEEPTPINLTPGGDAPFTPGLKARFCEALAGLVTAACRAVGNHCEQSRLSRAAAHAGGVNFVNFVGFRSPAQAGGQGSGTVA